MRHFGFLLILIVVVVATFSVAAEEKSQNEIEFLSDLKLFSWVYGKKIAKMNGNKALSDDDGINCPAPIIKGISDAALDYGRCFQQYPGRASCSYCGNKFRNYLNWMAQCPNDSRIKAMLDVQRQAYRITCP